MLNPIHISETNPRWDGWKLQFCGVQACCVQERLGIFKDMLQLRHNKAVFRCDRDSDGWNRASILLHRPLSSSTLEPELVHRQVRRSRDSHGCSRQRHVVMDGAHINALHQHQLFLHGSGLRSRCLELTFSKFSSCHVIDLNVGIPSEKFESSHMMKVACGMAPLVVRRTLTLKSTKCVSEITIPFLIKSVNKQAFIHDAFKHNLHSVLISRSGSEVT